MPPKDLETALLLRRTKEIELFPKVNTFLHSIARNSIKSKRSYSSGLTLLQNFLNEKEQQTKYEVCYNCEIILQPLFENKINVYELFDSIISYILGTKPEITPRSLSLYITALKSYFAYYDIDVIPSKFRRKVKMPKLYRENEEAIDAEDIRKILLSCNNRRLKAYLLVLASRAMRAVEALAVRLKDIDFSISPTRIHIRKEYAKTKVSRDVYISYEATNYLKQWIDWKYNNKERPRKTSNPEDLIFTLHNSTDPNVIYFRMYLEFRKLDFYERSVFYSIGYEYCIDVSNTYTYRGLVLEVELNHDFIEVSHLVYPPIFESTDITDNRLDDLSNRVQEYFKDVYHKEFSPYANIEIKILPIRVNPYNLSEPIQHIAIKLVVKADKAEYIPSIEKIGQIAGRVHSKVMEELHLNK